MSTQAIIGIVAAVVIIGGAVWYFSGDNAGTPAETQGVEEAKGEGEGTFADLIARSGSHTCTVTTYIQEAPSTGTVFVADGKVRGDFVTKPEAMGGAEVASHMIQADGYVYTWSDMMPQGMKIKLPEGEASATATTEGPVPSDTRVEYSCSSWIADGSKFVPPAGITFVELGAEGSFQIPMPN